MNGISKRMIERKLFYNKDLQSLGFFIHTNISPLKLKGCKFRLVMLGTHEMPLSIAGFCFKD